MKPKLLLSTLALVFAGTFSAFALLESIQLKPSKMQPFPSILIRSTLDWTAGHRIYWVLVLPGNIGVNTNLNGSLDVNEGTNRLASCPVAARILSNAPPKGWDTEFQAQYYHVMTNKFSRPLNGAKLFQFTVATNILGESTFSLYQDDFVLWFNLQDFCAPGFVDPVNPVKK